MWYLLKLRCRRESRPRFKGVWRSVDGKYVTGAEELGCARKPIWDSGFQSVLRFCDRLLEVPQVVKNRCSKLRVTEGLPVKTECRMVYNCLSISLCVPCEFFLSGDKKKKKRKTESCFVFTDFRPRILASHNTLFTILPHLALTGSLWG